ITVPDLISLLKAQHIRTWFDLGLFIDRIREDRAVPAASHEGPFHSFEKRLENNGIGFLTFFFSVDGVTVEINKYARLFKRNFPGANIHYISGNFKPEAEKHLPGFVSRCEIPEIQSFDKWKLYEDFFFTHLDRGSSAYNRLIIDFWDETLSLVEKIGAYISHHSISLLYIVNGCSNPGNVSLCLACVLLSEYLGIPVINNNHDFYWEGGNSDVNREVFGLKPGPRDFFFTNSHLGEIFSLVEMLYPWESRSWINVNINDSQSDYLVTHKGHNPANITEIGTAVDTAEYMNINKRKRINTFLQFEKILSRYQDRLIAYSAGDVIDNGLIDYTCPFPILIGAKTRPVEGFISENIIFLQPTRIISRKRIETGFQLLRKMFKNKAFRERLKTTPGLKITILVTGPVAEGQHAYLTQLILSFDELLKGADEAYNDRLFLAFLFSELDRESFKNYFEQPAGMPELYNISSLVLLPSKTEGRGLPIIEAAASGIPVFCRRYFPKNVYARVIGKHLDEKDRLKVIEFDGRTVKKKHVRKILNRVFFAHEFADELKHNRRVVTGRYSLEALNANIRDIIYRLYMQMAWNETTLERVKIAFNRYRALNDYTNPDLKSMLDTVNREYIAGFGKLGFMLRLKSLIDPSFFRIEEQHIRGYLFDFARGLIRKDPDYDLISTELKTDFYNAVDTIFLYREGT
ncbi:MAG TPA: glycosyltransferase, partial [Bacteroidales bacterium]|nr:glycosyltransferase [Bacteroidales bacterium]